MLRRLGDEAAAALEAAVDGVEPADHRVEPEQLGVDDERELDVVLVRVLLQPGVLLHQLDEVPAVGLHELRDVDIGEPQRDEHLDDELVARRRGRLGRGAQPLRPARRDPPR